VLPGHRIEISAREIPEGARVEVIIVPTATPERRSVLEIIEGLHGHRLFQTPEEVRRSLQVERDSWNR
jgi:hypothetical protein